MNWDAVGAIGELIGGAAVYECKCRKQQHSQEAKHMQVH
jgi:hypothetical protein